MVSRIARKGTSRYKIRNWKQYEAALIQRGSISFWINDDAIDQGILHKGIGAQIDILIKILQDCFSSIIFILKFGYHAISHSKERYKSL